MSGLRARMSRLQGKKTDSNHELKAINPEQEPLIQLAEPYNKESSNPSLLQLNHVQQSFFNQYITLEQLAFAEDYAFEWTKFGVCSAKNQFGQFLMKCVTYQHDDAIGMYPFGDWKTVAAYLNAFHPQANAHIGQLLFLDLETTGLGSGTGNVPFMVGLAFWDVELDQLIVQQAFIRHPAEERAMLAYLHHLTTHFTHLVTYNGKSFDWPLLHSRYVINGMREKIWEPLHIDLLHPSRALWRNTLESCRLSHIEKMRLGIVRVDDLPGSEAPAKYFEYLSNQKPEVMFDVFKHNEIDMLSLVTLCIRFGYLLSDHQVQNIIQHPNEPEELVRTGLWLERMGVTDYPEQLFDLAFVMPQKRNQTRMLLAARDKQKGEYKRAVLLWEQVVHSVQLIKTKDQIAAAVELSMYYEHKCKEFNRALQYAELALDYRQQWREMKKREQGAREKEIAELKKRIDRLKKKCNITI